MKKSIKLFFVAAFAFASVALMTSSKYAKDQKVMSGSICIPEVTCFQFVANNTTDCDYELFFEYDGPCGDIEPAFGLAPHYNTLFGSDPAFYLFTAYEMQFCDEPCHCPVRIKIREAGAGSFLNEPWPNLSSMTQAGSAPTGWVVTYQGWHTCNGIPTNVRVSILDSTGWANGALPKFEFYP